MPAAAVTMVGIIVPDAVLEEIREEALARRMHNSVGE